MQELDLVHNMHDHVQQKLKGGLFDFSAAFHVLTCIVAAGHTSEI